MIDFATASRLVELAAMVAAGLAVLGLVVAAVLRTSRAGALRLAAAVAPWALLIGVGWHAYLWRVRFNPATGFCGLHSVPVLLGNVAAALVVGVLYGLYLRWLWGLPLAARQSSQA